MRINENHGGYMWMEQCRDCDHVINNMSFSLGRGLCPKCGSQDIKKIRARWKWTETSSWPHWSKKHSNKHIEILK